MKNDYFKGRGAQINPNNRFVKHKLESEHLEGIDEELLQDEQTQFIYTYPKTIINKVKSSDLGAQYSMNPYQGCEHGCIYCYARNSHEYWGYSAGLDFERKILVKQNVPALLEKEFSKKSWEPHPIMLAGNTDCYQPIEKKLEITRQILQVCLKYKHPIGLISKNSLITRDIDILKELAALDLVHVMISITGTDEKMRLMLEPRTVTYKKRFEVVRELSDNGIPTGVMVAPIIPGINNHEITKVIELAAQHGAITAGYTIARLNGAIADIFKDWLIKNLPDRADKVWNQLMDCHGGQVNDSREKTRMVGEGKIAESIRQLFLLSKRRFMKKSTFQYNLTAFDRNAGDAQLSLF